ncbi:Maf-like protein [Christiangramia forsetii]|uniref:dTTP/UTP pyrophosphatase n=2 Tax=Christiangramia forsetii TaxID=411153 RepID=NTPPA_CHRFK|nr:Maf-like protein [Christiangramia forsetii]A0M2D8.1 RecName: Full=dTTP/UTP pyrophosphatase; Short=dTTPase/UTPase; AltName: Full=Nucleoside triphosphate pyrophosphatase; AltName: Full=Nucleotide pyrophosphatase; Short=Nucleotide PPase [Christiangramia forsetii KT0803]GGG39391.1 Maf-like protein [Christiangramia forsetii]CAL66783.1 septum formation protein Maf [Christiangramia forsetii KT0803]
MLQELLKNHEIILASGSPRRQKFFQDLEIPVKIDVRPVDEVFSEHLKKEEITDFLSVLKSEVFLNDLKENQILITSDTIVYNEAKALGKPKDHAEAVKMISSLSGKNHEVITSVCFTSKNYQKVLNHSTRVYFSELTEKEIEYYVTNFKPFDKAGGYAIQEWIGLIGIKKIEGSYFNVVGLPTHEVYKTLKEMLNS